ncbi:MAG: hypothetical protein JNL65_05150 [Saprospiraceae bacterium]|nr:hypothetical protein [Saprospiraceae bacterium]
MPFIDKLKAVFIVPEDPKSANSNKDSQEYISSTKPIDNTGTQGVNSESNARFLEILAQVLEKNNQPGFDYLEFRKAVQSIAQMQHLDEPNQFKTAFAAAQAFNVNADTLFDSAKKYLNVLEAEQIQFNKTADQYLQNQLNQKQTESGQLKQTIRNAEETLAQLQAKLDEDKKKLSALESDLSNAQLKVDSNKAAFESAYQQVVRQIKEDLQKMETYLK